MDKITTQSLMDKGFKKISEKEWVYNGEKNVVLDFFAEWCSPCKSLDVVMNSLSNEFTNFDFYKIDVEDEYELTEMFKITSLPTLIIINNGDIKKINGTISRQKLEDLLKSNSSQTIVA